MTRSLQSAHVLVNPHATWVLLPATNPGTPGSVTPISRCGSDGLAGSGHSIDARYQVLGTLMRRCMSLATSAWPSVASAPDTAQLLLPSASRSANPKSQLPSPKPQGCVP